VAPLLLWDTCTDEAAVVVVAPLLCGAVELLLRAQGAAIKFATERASRQLRKGYAHRPGSEAALERAKVRTAICISGRSRVDLG
jgi:hypothetical protein